MAVPRKTKTKKAESAVLTGAVSTQKPTAKSNLGHLLKAPVAQASTRTPVCDPSERFFLRHWPREWECEEVDGSPVWLPILGPHLLKPGTTNIRTLAKHEAHRPHLAYEFSVMSSRRDGWIYIDPDTAVPDDCLPDGVPEGGYLRSLDCVSRSGIAGEKWVEAWEVPVPTLPGEPQRWRFDRASYNRWRKHLVDSEQVPAPDAEWLTMKRDTVSKHLRRTKAKPLPTDLRAEMVAKHQARLDMIDSAPTPEAT